MRRKKRLKLIENRIEKYKNIQLDESQMIELLNDAIWLLDDFGREWDKMFPKEKKVLTCNKF